MNIHKNIPNDTVEEVSQKIEKLNNLPSMKLFTLPERGYGPFCLKILFDFVEFHNLPKGMLMPVPGLTNVQALSRIFDIILHSMGEEKRLQAISELEEYIKGLPEPPKKSSIILPR